MNTGQSILTLAALMLLTMVASRINFSILQTQEVMQNSKFGLAAISLATSVIEEASKEAFDEQSIDSMLITPAGLTAYNQLGPDGVWEYIYGYFGYSGGFDDFDDWSAYQLRDTTLMSAHYDLRCVINYIDAANPDVAVTTKTFHKKLTVLVSSPSMKDTIRLSTIYSYWKFR
jgi:hypothetical protein